MIISKLSVFLYVGGELSLPQNLSENSKVLESTQSFHNVCDVEGQAGKVSWLGLIPDLKGQWVNPSTGQPPDFTNWKVGKEIDSEDNCAFLLENGKWSSTTCNQQSPRYNSVQERNSVHIHNSTKNTVEAEKYCTPMKRFS